MERTWASGAIELLKHADSHAHLNTAFDRRIGFISIDNAVETCVRVFVSLPVSKSGVRISRKELSEVETSFPHLLELLWDRAGDRLVGLDPSDIEHFHRIRNKLYHDGTGLSVDEDYILAYRQIAVVLLQQLFGVFLGNPRPAPTLERLVALWNSIELLLEQRAQSVGLEVGHTFFWEEAMQVGLIGSDSLRMLTELRLIRNTELHSSSIDRKRVEYGVGLAEALTTILEGARVK